jgi:NTE family protein
MAGSSAGAALLAAGYTAPELRGLEDRIRKTRFPILPDVMSLLEERGICEGEALHAWISDLLAAKGVRTFGDLLRRPEAGPEDLRFRYRLRVISDSWCCRGTRTSWVYRTPTLWRWRSRSG